MLAMANFKIKRQKTLPCLLIGRAGRQLASVAKEHAQPLMISCWPCRRKHIQASQLVSSCLCFNKLIWHYSLLPRVLAAFIVRVLRLQWAKLTGL